MVYNANHMLLTQSVGLPHMSPVVRPATYVLYKYASATSLQGTESCHPLYLLKLIWLHILITQQLSCLQERRWKNLSLHLSYQLICLFRQAQGQDGMRQDPS